MEFCCFWPRDRDRDVETETWYTRDIYDLNRS